MIFYKASAAFEYLKKLYVSQIARVDLVNHDRHMVLYLKDGSVLYCLFKTTFVHSFNEYAPANILEKYPGQGESINYDWLFYARNLNAKLIYIYRDGSIYSIYPNQVINAGFIRNQIRDFKYIENNKEVIKNEREYWFSVKLLEKVEV